MGAGLRSGAASWKPPGGDVRPLGAGLWMRQDAGSTRGLQPAVSIHDVSVIEYLTTRTPGPGHPGLYELHTHQKRYVGFLLEVGQNGDLSGAKSHLIPSCWPLSGCLL